MSATAVRTILVTGCSSGIGHHCALGLARRGWRVIASARKAEDVERLGREGLTAIRLDVDDSVSIREGVARTLELTDGRLDALFNNGAYGQPGAVEDLTRAVLRAQLETNLLGWHELTCQVIPIMRRQGHGRIVQNSSILGLVPLPYRGAYVASKYALEGLTDTLRLELRGSGIQVSMIEPGPISSRFRENAHRLIGHEEAQHLLDQLARRSPKLVENLLSSKALSLGVVLKVLQNLLAEQVSIRDLRTIAETLAERAPKSQDPVTLTAAVRVALSRSIVQDLLGPDDELPLIALDPMLEQLLHKSFQGSQGETIGIEPGLAERVQRSVADAARRQEAEGTPAILVVAPEIRPWIASWLRGAVRNLSVIAFTEIPDNRRIRVVATVGKNDGAPART